MHIRVGDLVKLGQKLGLVVDQKISNEGLNSSMHVRHILSTYPQVYYVLFPGEGRSGPYHETDLKIQQKCQTTNDTIEMWTVSSEST